MTKSPLPSLYFPANDGETPQVSHFRLLRERLLELESARTLLVTSAEPEEGSTTVAANLALCLAEFGQQNVLLIEANFRRPTLATLFNTPRTTDFAAQLLARHKGSTHPYRPVTLPGQTLHVLAVSPGSSDSISVAWPAFQSVLSEFRALSWIGHIVIDGPPTLGSTDAKLIAQRCDRVLLTAIARRTRAKSLTQAAIQLAPASVAGVVLLTEKD